MLERPAISDSQLEAGLDAFARSPARIEFLPIGNDARSFVFRVDCVGGETVFLKLRKGPLYPPAMQVPHYLYQSGIQEVVAPIPSRTGELWTPFGEDTLILYPFIEGPSGMDAGLNTAQWTAFGSTLRRIHAASLPAPLAALVQAEAFQLNPRCLEAITQLSAEIPATRYASPSERELAGFWLARAAEIGQIVARAADLGRRMQRANPPLVLCHSDIHTANLILGPRGLAIIDWDQPIFAPKERDLMFIGSGGSFGNDLSREEQLFYAGYGPTQVDALAIAYYRYEWVVQEIGDYAERVFLAQDYTEETRLDSVRGFKQLFEPGDVLDSARDAVRQLEG